MKRIDMDAMSASQRYHLLTGLIVPRPIAWVSTINSHGQSNLAPFSYFNIVSHDPAFVVFSVGEKAGQPKDTLVNLRDVPEMVIHIPEFEHAKAVTDSAISLPYGESEAEVLGLEMVDSELVRPQRLKHISVAMEARVHQLIPVPPSTSTMVLAEILRIHVNEEVFNEEGRIAHEVYQPIARLEGSNYSKRGEVFAYKRP